MPNGDPRDGFFFPTLTLVIDSYTIIQQFSTAGGGGDEIEKAQKAQKTSEPTIFSERKIVNIFLPISFNICFGCSKEPSH